MANGFLLDLALKSRAIQVLEEVGGWRQVLAHFLSDHVLEMERYPDRSMVLLIDFDGETGRLNEVKSEIPGHLTNRVYILGVLREPEDLKKSGLGSYETIGLGLAKDCREETDTTWGHDLLRHNAAEVTRLRQSIRPILF